MTDDFTVLDPAFLETIDFPSTVSTDTPSPLPDHTAYASESYFLHYSIVQPEQFTDPHSEEVEAIHEAFVEERNELDRRGVVIRYRERYHDQIFRSSSLAPVSPTPNRARLSSPEVQLVPESSPSPTMAELPSSPPINTAESTPNSRVSRNPLPSSDRFVPKFTLPLTGGLLRFAEPKKVPELTLNHLAPTLGTVEVVTSSGDSIQISRKRKRPSSHQQSSVDAPIGISREFYGVPITNLMDQLAVQKTEQSPSVDLPELAPSDAGRKKKTLWTEKYRAKRFTDLVGDERTHRHVLHWLKCWEAQVFGSVTSKRPNPEGSVEHKKVLLLHGPPGLGKTTLAHVAARQAGYRAVEINASDDRSSGVVKGKIKDILSTEGIQSCGVGSGAKNTVDHRPLCLVIDEIDGVVGGQDGGFIQALIGLINADEVTRKHSGKRTRRGRKNDFRLCRPIVAVCNDLYAPALKPLRQVAEIVQMRPPPRGLVEERLESIFAREGLTTGNGAVRRLIELSSHGSSSGQAGDIRGALINAQWISARLRSANAQTPCLTRQIVEEELGGKTVGKGDGKSSNKGSLSIRDAVDTIFRLDKNAGGSALPMRTASARRVQDLVEALGEFDKITADCFASYPTRHYNDDFRLSKPNMAYEWLYFADLLSSRQAHELAHYLCQPVVAFHHLFASPTASAAFDKDATEDPPPFSGMNADWEAREMTKHHHSVIQTLHSSLDSIRLSQTFKSPASISTELAPYLNMMISPNISPVVIRGKDGLSVSSVRRDSEKALVSRAVEAMTATGVRFEKVRVEAVSDGHNPSWAYRMDPSVDSLSMYPCWKGESAARQPVRYAVRQVLEQEWQKSKILRDQAAREARMGALSQLAPEQAVTTTPTVQAAKPSRSDKKRDFFGRIIEEAGSDQAQTSAQKRRRVGSDKTTQSVWISFHEGYSNAVRKPIRLSEILEGL